MKTLRRHASETTRRNEEMLRARNDATLTRISKNIKSGLLRMTESVTSSFKVRRPSPSMAARARDREEERRLESERQRRARFGCVARRHPSGIVELWSWISHNHILTIGRYVPGSVEMRGICAERPTGKMLPEPSF